MTGRSTPLKVLLVACLLVGVGCAVFFAINSRGDTATPAADQAFRPATTMTSSVPDAPRPRFAVIGDSYTGGSDAGGYGPDSWPNLFLDELSAAGTPATADVSGRGGSGYVRRGNEGTIFGEEVPRVVRPDDKVVVFFGSMNDGSSPPADVAAAANSAFDVAQRIAPQATLLVIGPAWPHPDPPPGLLAVRDVLAEAAKAHNGIFVDPIAEGWLVDRPDTIGFDNIHPTNAGHEIMAKLIGSRLAPLLRPNS